MEEIKKDFKDYVDQVIDTLDFKPIPETNPRIKGILKAENVHNIVHALHLIFAAKAEEIDKGDREIRKELLGISNKAVNDYADKLIG